MVGRGTQQDLYGGPPLKTMIKNEGKLPDSMEMEIGGVKIQLRFAEKESPGIKDRVIEVLCDLTASFFLLSIYYPKILFEISL